MIPNKPDTTPVYNLKVVIHETGIKPDTVRAWERRYGLPQPQRTAGGHRLYSDRDIALIKWLMARQQEGMSISKAVKLYRTLAAEGKDPLVQAETAVSTPTLPDDATLNDLRQNWINACLQFDEETAETTLTQAFALYPPLIVCNEILLKGMADIGNRWYQNQATVQQEHFASALAMRRLHALVAAAPRPTRAGRALIGCPAGEEHTLPPLLLTLMLRHQGWDVLYLGANVPIARLESTIETTNPRLVIFTAQQLHTAASLRETAEFVQQTNIPLAFGGRIFNLIPQLRQHIPGHFLGETINESVATAHQLLHTPQPTPTPPPIPESLQAALAVFQAKQAVIEAAVWQKMRVDSDFYRHIANANLFLAQDILAALQLGNLSWLGTQIKWIETLLQNYEMPVSLLKAYLTTYHQVARETLGEDGRPIIEWLAQMVNPAN